MAARCSRDSFWLRTAADSKPYHPLAPHQDVPGALPSGEISDRLGLAGGEKSREWSVRGSCALTGDGLEEVRPSVLRPLDCSHVGRR